MAKIKPSKALIYLFYKCSKCKAAHPELRWGEATRPRKLHCMLCGNVDEVLPVRTVEIKYQSQLIQPDSTSTQAKIESRAEIDMVTDTLKQLGYKSRQISAAIKVVTSKFNPTDSDTLLKLTLKEIANATTQTKIT